MTAQIPCPSEEKLARWHYVSNISYLGPVRFKRLYEMFGDDIERIFSMKEIELTALKNIVTPQVLDGIKKQRGKRRDSEIFAKEQLHLSKDCGGFIVLLDSPNYPNFLYDSTMCHPILFCRGQLHPFVDYRKSLAIVGTREAANASLNLAHETARELARKGWVIVSGMAKGVDAQAHEGALAENGKTIAVLASGVDKPYPPECRLLYERIIKKNLVISEYPFGARSIGLQLKKRNKTTVALSLGAFVVQTSKTGGAMNAVQACCEQHKPVFTIKHDGSGYSGNAWIIDQGGIAVSQNNPVAEIEKVCLSPQRLTDGIIKTSAFLKRDRKAL